APHYGCGGWVQPSPPYPDRKAPVQHEPGPFAVGERLTPLVLRRRSEIVSLLLGSLRNIRKHYWIRTLRDQTRMSATRDILVVEDDLEISRLVTRYLRANDCRVSAAGDGRNVARMIADDRIDLVVLDLMLPGEDGLSICQRLRMHSDVPVIMLTA